MLKKFIVVYDCDETQDTIEAVEIETEDILFALIEAMNLVKYKREVLSITQIIEGF